MRKKINDMIYTLLSRLSYEEYRVLGDLNLTTKFIGLITFIEYHPSYLHDEKILKLLSSINENNLTKEKVDEIENYINNYNPKNKKYTLTEYAKKLHADTEEKVDVIEKCKNIKLTHEFIKNAIIALKELISKEELGEDITDISNMELFHSLNYVDLKSEEKEALIELYVSWQKQIEKEYYELKSKRPQTIGLLLPLNDFKSSSYPKICDSLNCEKDISEKANYIRNLLKQSSDNSFIDSLLGNDTQIILLRIIFDIENEISILDSYENITLEEMVVIEELKEELLTEKENIKKRLGGICKWKKC